MAESFGEASTHTNLPGSTPQFIRAWSVTATTAWASEIYTNKHTHIKTIRKNELFEKISGTKVVAFFLMRLQSMYSLMDSLSISTLLNGHALPKTALCVCVQWAGGEVRREGGRMLQELLCTSNHGGLRSSTVWLM